MRFIVTLLFCVSASIARANDPWIYYEYTASITDPGIPLFHVGDQVRGRLVVYTRSADLFPDDPEAGRYVSERSSITFDVAGHDFASASKTITDVMSGQYSDTFAHTALDVSVPDGWYYDTSTGRSSFGFMLQSSPHHQVFPDDSLPGFVDFNQFRWREVLLDFHDGVQYPGGETRSRTLIRARITSLTIVPAPSALASMAVCGFCLIRPRR